MAVEIPAEMLARLAQATFDAVEREHVLVMRYNVVGECLRRSWNSLRACAGGGRSDAAGDPRCAIMRAADHHRVGAGLFEDCRRLFRRAYIAIGHDRDRDGFLDARDGAPVGLALIELAARAAMHGHHPDAGLFGAARQHRRVERAFVPTKPHLDRHRHRNGADHRLDQRQRMI